MYGWINASLESLILNNYGADVWAQITEEAGCPVQTGDFIRNVNYPDDLTKRLIETCCKVLEISQEELVENSGVNFIRFVQQNGYESTIRCQGTTFAEWLRNLNEPHRLLKSRFPDSKFPEFWCVNDDQDETGQTLILHYYSYRGELFAPMVIGCVKEAAKVYFHLDVELDPVFQQLNDNTLHAAWRIIIVNQAAEPNSPKKRAKFEHVNLITNPPNTEVEFDRAAITTESSTSTSNFNDMMDKAKATGKCPFSHMASNKPSAIKLQNPPPFPLRKPMVVGDDMNSLDGSETSTTGESSSSQDSSFERVPCSYNIGLSPHRLKDAFPFHLVINHKLQIIQVGDKLARLILENNQFAKILQSPVSEFFGIAIPPNYPWDWKQLIKLEDTTVELTLLRSVRKVSFRGSFFVMTPEKDGPSVTETSAMFLININIHNINEMSDMNLKLSDFPRHNFQRDLLIIGEHLKSEASSAVELGVLSKKLNQESKSSLVSSTSYILSTHFIESSTLILFVMFVECFKNQTCLCAICFA